MKQQKLQTRKKCLDLNTIRADLLTTNTTKITTFALAWNMPVSLNIEVILRVRIFLLARNLVDTVPTSINKHQIYIRTYK